MERIHRGSGICSYRRRKVGAILLVRVPATSIMSACLGDARITIPKRSMSYRLIAACIISTAQHAKPKVSGQSDPARAHDMTEVNLVEIHSSFISALEN
jgi:hypothetical protein